MITKENYKRIMSFLRDESIDWRAVSNNPEVFLENMSSHSDEEIDHFIYQLRTQFISTCDDGFCWNLK